MIIAGLGIGPLLAVGLNALLARAFSASGTFTLGEFRGFWWSLGVLSLVGLGILIIGLHPRRDESAEGA